MVTFFTYPQYVQRLEEHRVLEYPSQNCINKFKIDEMKNIHFESISVPRYCFYLGKNKINYICGIIGGDTVFKKEELHFRKCEDCNSERPCFLIENDNAETVQMKKTDNVRLSEPRRAISNIKSSPKEAYCSRFNQVLDNINLNTCVQYEISGCMAKTGKDYIFFDNQQYTTNNLYYEIIFDKKQCLLQKNLHST